MADPMTRNAPAPFSPQISNFPNAALLTPKPSPKFQDETAVATVASQFCDSGMMPQATATQQKRATSPPPSASSFRTNLKAPPQPSPEPLLPGLPQAPLDPRYIAMVSRIAAFYQQRCQAVANYQQQKCQQWAAMHRQKCRQMVQGSMLVVAWYIRDRIQKRRRKERRRFRRALGEKGAEKSGVPRGETVRRWVLQVADGAPEVTGDGKLADKEEADFNMDRELTPDTDTKLFAMADDMIKSQSGKIEVPVLGALSFDESASESESEEEKDEQDGAYEGEQGEAMEEGESEMDDADFDDMDDDEYEDDDGAMENVSKMASKS